MPRDPRGTLSPLQKHVTQPLTYAAMRTALLPAHLFPLPTVLRAASSMGERFGNARFNQKRVDQAIKRLEVAFPEMDLEQRKELVSKAYQHLAMLGVELAVTPRLLSEDAWTDYVQLGNLQSVMRPLLNDRPTLLLTGHCGNWEIIGYTMALLGFNMHAIYRPLDLRPADAWVRQTRSRRGLDLLDKFGVMKAMPTLMEQGEAVAFVADQNAGDRGLQVPYFGRLASSYKSIGLTALQYDANILIGQARRLPTTPGTDQSMRYRIEVVDQFSSEDWNDQPDPLFYITARYRRSIETMIRNTPEQYLWMHRIWKSRPRHERLNKPFPESLKRKLANLPWMTDDELAKLIDRSDRDRAYMAEHNITHFK
ncbi:MAG: lysophospholipid acyltransferase family protein [Phycisphaerales bacterium]